MHWTVLALIWSGVVGYIVCSTVRTRRHLAQQTVQSVEISVTDSTAQMSLVSSPMIREWILRSGISTIGVPVGEVDMTGLEDVIRRNGFVRSVGISSSYDGVLSVEVGQRKPILRIMTSNYNAYVTAEEFVFRTPALSSVYVPVVTGDMPLPFAPDEEGSMIDKRIREMTRLDSAIYASREMMRAYERKAARRQKQRASAAERAEGKRKWYESKYRYEGRKKNLQDSVSTYARLRSEAADTAAMFRSSMEKASAEQKNLLKRYEDFSKLINFVKLVEKDDFWHAEVVQIDVSYARRGVPEITLVPRSGDYVIELGDMDDAERKLDKMMRFYKSGLAAVGFDKYSRINVEYDGQVVCTK